MSLLFTEKYRPDNINDCILPERLKQELNNMIEVNNLPHLLLTGDSGIGKTTVAKILCNKMKCEYLVFNGSSGELNIDKLREDITEFVSTVPLQGKSNIKVVLIDEADGLSHIIQPALRNFMEKYNNARFILTANYPDKIIAPLQSRCTRIDFKFDKDEMTELIRCMAHRLSHILKQENIPYDNDGIIYVCKEFFPDFRRTINECQRYVNYNNKLDIGIEKTTVGSVSDLFEFINSNDFSGIKQWSSENTTSTIFNTLFKHYQKYIDINNQPMFIMCLGEGMKHHSTVPNQELNFLATIVSYMENI